MVGHPTIAELMVNEGFDWIAVDLEHTATSTRTFQEIALAVKNKDCDLLARLDSCDPVQAKRVLDAGGSGIIVPLVNTAEQAQQAVAMAKFPPDGFRGAAFSRASDYGRNFRNYYLAHNDSVIVVIMMEHIDAVNNADAILETPGIDAVFIGPYDLSASLGRPGELDHPDVLVALGRIMEACKRHHVPVGIHVIGDENAEVEKRISEGFRFIACSIDTQFIIRGCRRILGSRVRSNNHAE